ncbi:hypothetical protein QQP08_004767 [Theobroma cacao]|nr:hypothetical protein QQP08_004767 [Theobroma cacao]
MDLQVFTWNDHLNMSNMVKKGSLGDKDKTPNIWNRIFWLKLVLLKCLEKNSKNSVSRLNEMILAIGKRLNNLLLHIELDYGNGI